jgi:phosphoglycolate phosphatase-like HAD superfamily hydrolase
MEAARGAGVRGIGYAKRPERRDQLADAGAAEVIDGMADLAHVLKAAL